MTRADADELRDLANWMVDAAIEYDRETGFKIGSMRRETHTANTAFHAKLDSLIDRG
jgi:hypothetical protein